MVDKVVAQSNKRRNAPEKEADVKATTLGWNLEDESNNDKAEKTNSFKKSSTLGGASGTVKDLYSMYVNG